MPKKSPEALARERALRVREDALRVQRRRDVAQADAETARKSTAATATMGELLKRPCGKEFMHPPWRVLRGAGELAVW